MGVNRNIYLNNAKLSYRIASYILNGHIFHTNILRGKQNSQKKELEEMFFGFKLRLSSGRLPLNSFKKRFRKPKLETLETICYLETFLIKLVIIWPLNTVDPRYSQTFYLQNRLFTFTKLVKNDNFQVKIWLLLWENSVFAVRHDGTYLPRITWKTCRDEKTIKK